MNPTSNKKFARAALVGSVAVFLLSAGAWQLSLFGDRASPASRSGLAADASADAALAGLPGVPARDADSASRAYKGGWYVDDGQRYADLADASKDMSTLLAEHRGDEQYVDMERWTLGEWNEETLVRSYQCDKHHLDGFARTCDFKLDFVIRRTAEREGKVVFVRTSSEKPLDSYCQAYSDCLAHNAFLGDTAPLPAGNDEAIAIQQGHRMVPFKGSKEEFQTLMRREHRKLTAEYESALSDPTRSPRELERLELLVKFVGLRLENEQ